MRISEEKIEQVRSSANIVDVVSDYVQLKKRGKNFIGLCPFHQEKTPSFTVSPEKQIYHCFGCHTGGNVFSFLMEYKSVSFVEAVQELAESLGIPLEYDAAQDTQQSEQEILYDINVFAAKYFSNNLFNDTNGEVARNYFKQRNVKPQTQRTFGLGYALPSWEHFLSFAKGNKIDLQQVKRLGLIDIGKDGSYYDKFRGRIIFPIFSPNGRVIGFGGRILDNSKDIAKYLNSPESLIYSKRKTLYGLYQAKEEIRKLDKAILVEGYMDVIALFQSGIKNVVASSGTSLTDEQVQLLSRYTKNIVVLFDADLAGQKAAMRSIEILLKKDFEVKILSLPEGEDPDSFVTKFGKKEFEEKLLRAINFLEFQAETFEKNGMLSTPEKQTEAIREIVKSIAIIEDELKRSIYIKTIAKKFNLREKLLESELDKFLNRNTRKENVENERKRKVSEKETVKIANKNFPIENKFELEIIKLLFEGEEEILDIIFDYISPEEFNNMQYRKLASIVLENYKKDIIVPAQIIEKIEDDALRELIMELTLKQEVISSKHGEEIISKEATQRALIQQAKDVVKKFKILQINKQISENNEKLSDSDSDEEILKILNENKELKSEIKLIQEEDLPKI